MARDDRVLRLVDDAYIQDLARAVAGELGGQVGVAPRVFLRKLVADVLDRVAEFADFDPRQHYKLTLSGTELTETERNAAAFQPRTADDIELTCDGVTGKPVTGPWHREPPPELAHNLVATLGWTTLRPLQREAIEPVLRGDDALLLAPTAGGKTEAAALPHAHPDGGRGWTGLSVLYLCPLKALLNNLLPRLEVYGGWSGRRVALWHGDTPASRRKSILHRPAGPAADDAGIAGVHARQPERRPPSALPRPARGHRGRGPRVRRRRPGLAPPRRPRAPVARRRPTVAAHRPVCHGRESRSPACTGSRARAGKERDMASLQPCHQPMPFAKHACN